MAAFFCFLLFFSVVNYSLGLRICRTQRYVWYVPLNRDSSISLRALHSEWNTDALPFDEGELSCLELSGFHQKRFLNFAVPPTRIVRAAFGMECYT